MSNCKEALQPQIDLTQHPKKEGLESEPSCSLTVATEGKEESKPQTLAQSKALELQKKWSAM